MAQDRKKITAIIATGKTPERYELAELSIESFLAQTYPNKELLIVNDGVRRLDKDNDNVKEIYLDDGKDRNVGHLRNIAKKHISGDGFTILWDDDDWHHPDLMRYQHDALQDEYTACLLQNQARYSFPDDFMWVHEGSGVPATFLERNNDRLFSGAVRGSDTTYIPGVDRLQTLDNPHHYYIRFFHSRNLWGRSHFDLDSKESLSEPTEEIRNYVSKIVRKYREEVSWLDRVRAKGD